MLTVRDLHAFYGKSHILHGVNLHVGEGEIVSLLGRNGVGRSTTIKAIMGDVAAHGSVRFRDEELCGLPTYAIARRGLGYVPENRDIFPTLTVSQNLLLGQKNPKKPGRWSMEDMFALFPPLRERAAAPGGVLSGGEQQMLTVARTLMGNPRVLLLDEPSEGLAPVIVRALGDQIAALKREGLTILLSEQNLKFAARLADRAYIIEKGEIRFDGPMSQLMADEALRRKYLTV